MDQVIFGMPNSYRGAKKCFTYRGRHTSYWSFFPHMAHFGLQFLSTQKVRKTRQMSKYWQNFNFGENQIFSQGPKMQNKPNFFFNLRGSQKGGVCHFGKNPTHSQSVVAQVLWTVVISIDRKIFAPFSCDAIKLFKSHVPGI